MSTPTDQQSPSNLDAQGVPTPPGFDEEFERRKRRTRTWLLFLILTPVLGFAVISFFYGRNFSAQMLIGRALEKRQAGDFHGALADLESAAELAPEMTEIFHLHFEIRVQDLKDLEGAEADTNKWVERWPEFALGYTLRSQVYQRQTFADPNVNRHAEAIADLKEALKLSSSREPMPYNNLAYARALAGVELPEGLQDAERALELLDKEADQLPEDSPGKPLVDNSRAAVLDTRGFLHHLLGNDEQALADLDESISLTESSAAHMIKLAEEGKLGISPERLQKSRDHTLSVLHHHRSVVYRKLGQEEEADADAAQAKELGFDPPNGVF